MIKFSLSCTTENMGNLRKYGLSRTSCNVSGQTEILDIDAKMDLKQSTTPKCFWWPVTPSLKFLRLGQPLPSLASPIVQNIVLNQLEVERRQPAQNNQMLWII
jgi:hypothetical protein